MQSCHSSEERRAWAKGENSFFEMFSGGLTKNTQKDVTDGQVDLRELQMKRAQTGLTMAVSLWSLRSDQ